jgi:hypothetical protein
MSRRSGRKSKFHASSPGKRHGRRDGTNTNTNSNDNTKSQTGTGTGR